MSRRKNGSVSGRNNNSFKFVHWKWSDDQLAGLRKFLGDSGHDYSQHILYVIERDWKISVSQHTTSGRYLCTLTDKRGRRGCDNSCFIVEHSDIENALLGAFYLASEILEDGNPRDDDNTDLDQW